MGNYNIFFSPTGGTKKAADILAKDLFTDYAEVDLCKEIDPIAFDAQDVCLISVPSYGGRVPGVAIERIRNLSGDGAKAVLNCVYGNREWEDTFTELQDTLEDCGFVCVAAVAAVAEHSIFRQFAAGRPDENDQVQLTAFAEQICMKLDSGVFNRLELTGSHGTYKEYGGVPFKPVGNADCGGCGLCAAACPVGAIPAEEPNKTNTEKCISCMRCVTICPQHARDFDAEFMKERSEKMAPALSGHKENHLFL